MKNKRSNRVLSYEEVSKLFYYDETSPTLIRCATNTHKAKKGDAVGILNKTSGYYMLNFNGESHNLHRLVFVLYNKVNIDSNIVIDHIDRNKTNNHPSNLRATDYFGNNRNSSDYSCNKSGHRGIYWYESCKRFRVNWYEEGKEKCLYFYPQKEYPDLTLEEAKAKSFEKAIEFRKSKEVEHLVVKEFSIEELMAK